MSNVAVLQSSFNSISSTNEDWDVEELLEKIKKINIKLKQQYNLEKFYLLLNEKYLELQNEIYKNFSVENYDNNNQILLNNSKKVLEIKDELLIIKSKCCKSKKKFFSS